MLADTLHQLESEPGAVGYILIDARMSFGIPIFREVIITSYWILRTTRNRVILDNASFSLGYWLEDFKRELGLACTKAKHSISVPLILWRDGLL